MNWKKFTLYAAVLLLPGGVLLGISLAMQQVASKRRPPLER